jgi:chemotaxis protein MotA
MDKATVAGLILAWVSLILSVALEGGELQAFLKLGPAVLVFGGTLGAAMVGVSMGEITGLPKRLRKAFFQETMDVDALAKQFMSFAATARRDGILALENQVEELANPFMKRGFQMAVDGTDSDSLRDIMEADIAATKVWYKQGEEFFRQLGGFSPTLGIIGTVLGLIDMLSNLEDSESMGPAIASAFIATMYGVSAANLVFLPIANKLKTAAEKEIRLKRFMLEGICCIQAGMSMRTIEERLSAMGGDEIKKAAPAGD